MVRLYKNHKASNPTSDRGSIPDPSLIGHWKLVDNCKDYSGYRNNGENRGVTFNSGSAIFDGRGAFVHVPDSESLHIGTGNFSIATWVYTAEKLDDVLGDIISKYDPLTRSGFSMGIQNHAGVVGTQVNYRNLHFGVDNARIDSGWTDCGRPGNAIFVMSLCVHDGHLYAGTCETAEGDLGHVYRYEGGQEWVDCGAPDNCNAVQTLVSFKEDIYAGSAYHDPHGSLLPESYNKEPGGSVFRYDGDKKWISCGSLGEGITTVQGLTEFKGKLYAFSWYEKGFFRYDGGNVWTPIASPQSRLLAMTPFNGHLYATANRLSLLSPTGKHSEQRIVNNDGTYRFDDTTSAWTGCGKQPDATQIYSIAVHRGDIYTGTWPNGEVFRYVGHGTWETCGRVDDQEEIMGLLVYNGKLYAGTLPSAKIYRYDGPNNWTNTGQLDTTPGVRFRRAFTPVVYRGRIYCGTLPAGRVFSLEAGKNVTYDKALKPGWRHIAAVKTEGTLKLYVDGKVVSTSLEFDPSDYDISNDRPLEIGFGAHDCFYGRLKDLHIYSRALTDTEVAGFYRNCRGR